MTRRMKIEGSKEGNESKKREEKEQDRVGGKGSSATRKTSVAPLDWEIGGK